MTLSGGESTSRLPLGFHLVIVRVQTVASDFSVLSLSRCSRYPIVMGGTLLGVVCFQSFAVYQRGFILGMIVY